MFQAVLIAKSEKESKMHQISIPEDEIRSILYQHYQQRQLSIPWIVHHDINFEAITNLMNKYIYSYNITILYMFRASLCSSSGG